MNAMCRLDFEFLGNHQFFLHQQRSGCLILVGERGHLLTLVAAHVARINPADSGAFAMTLA